MSSDIATTHARNVGELKALLKKYREDLPVRTDIGSWVMVLHLPNTLTGGHRRLSERLELCNAQSSRDAAAYANPMFAGRAQNVREMQAILKRFRDSLPVRTDACFTTSVLHLPEIEAEPWQEPAGLPERLEFVGDGWTCSNER